MPLRDWLADQLRRRPAAAVAIAFLTGIAIHAALPCHPLLYMACIAACGVAAVQFRSNAQLGTIHLLCAVFFAGLCIAQIEKYRFPDNHIAHFAKDQPRLAQLELYIDHQPRVLADPFSVGRALPPKQVCVARVTRVLTWDGWRASTGEILVQIDQPHPRLEIDQTVRVLGMLQRPSPAMNPGQFDWAEYYREQRILCSIGVDQAENIQIIARHPHSPLTTLRQYARHFLTGGFTANHSLDHALLGALLLGDHDPELRDVQEQFRRTGTSHHLAISGMHVAILGGVVLAACRLLLLSPRVSAVVALLFVVVYGAAALPSPPVIRSVLLCAAFSIGLLGRRSVDALQLLAVSVIAMLVYHPLDLFNAGFQLSFGTVLGLILFTKPLAEWILPPDPDVAVLRSFHILSAQRQAFEWVKRWVVTILSASAVAWIVSAPLIAFHFEQLNPWAIPGSILLAPFVFAALIGGFLKVLLSAAIPLFNPAWATLATLPMEAMRDVVQLLSRLPRSDVPLPQPPLWAVVGFYLLLLLWRLPIARPRLRRGWRAGGIVGMGCLVAVSLAGGFRAPDPVQPRVDEVSLTVLAVGAGQCVVVAPPRGPLVLIDAGSGTLRDPLRKCIAPFVRHVGRSSVGRIILTHGDYDHISAVAEIVQAYGVNEVMTGPHFARHADGNGPAEGLLRFLDQTDRTVLELVPGNRINLGGGASLDVLWPPRENGGLSSNDSGLVLKLSYAGRTILLPADIQVDAQRALLAGSPHLRADVLVSPHHGSGEETTAEFVRAVDPSIIISSNDRTLTMKQLDFEWMIPGRRHYRTHRDGSVTVRIDRAGTMTVHTYRPSP